MDDPADLRFFKDQRFLAAVAGVFVLVVLVGLGIIVNRAGGPGVPVAVGTPAPSPATGPIPYADCAKVAFGDPLQPVNAPSDAHKYSAPPTGSTKRGRLYQATITTAKGAIVLCLQPELAPNTVDVIVGLARNHYFDGLTFHRVEPNFVIQGGDPTGTGSGGPGFSFGDEPVRQSYVDGAVAMANSGANTNGSQFYVCIGSQCGSLEPKYNLFGKVESGLDVAKRIEKKDVITTLVVREQR